MFLKTHFVALALMTATLSPLRAATDSQAEKPSSPAPLVSAAPPKQSVEADIDQSVTRKVREGFETRDEIVQDVTEMIEDEHTLSGLRARVGKAVDRILAVQAKEEATWSAATDCDKIDAAFAALERQGIVARQNFTDCQTCGSAEIGDEIRNFSGKARPIGYTFYHTQDTEHAAEDGSLFLAYGSIGENKAEAVKIGEMIREMLVRHGLKVVWNGSLEQRICITEISWKKRRITKAPVVEVSKVSRS